MISQSDIRIDSVHCLVNSLLYNTNYCKHLFMEACKKY